MEHKKAENGKLREISYVTNIQEREMNATIAHLIWVVASIITEEVRARIGILEASMAGRRAQAFAFAVEMVTRS